MNLRNGDAEKPLGAYGVRVTRSRARAVDGSGGIFPVVKPCYKPDPKVVSRENVKRAALDAHATTSTSVSGPVLKRRAVLRDVTNVTCNNSVSNCIKVTKVQKKPLRKCPTRKRADPVITCSEDIRTEQKEAKTSLAEELAEITELELQDGAWMKDDKGHKEPSNEVEDVDSIMPVDCAKPSKHKFDTTNAFSAKKVINIDSNTTDPQLCSLYAPDIHQHLNLLELDQRPLTTYMEDLQRDITPSMRGILIDWLVEVCEEYKLVPDTLYLTINLLDRFLSHNPIEKHRLQLLGVTCMLISSKYEEICAPRVEEFCIITDNTYTRDEVLEIENQVLNFLCFRLSVPTTKTFLRRFIFAAQACIKVPPPELEFLANYLAELTLLEYDFLKYLPSMIAASAVFLASWTLNHAEHPWNPTLEHYTNYSASDLKAVVVELEDLQLNKANSPLIAIREKYKQQKFKCVATLTSPRRVLTLF